MSVKKRLTDFIKSKKLTIKEFERTIGSSNGYVNSISRSIGIDKIESIIEKFPTINLDWLMTGRGKMEFLDMELENGDREMEDSQEYESLMHDYKILLEKYLTLLERHNTFLENKLIETLGNDKSASAV